MKLAIAAALLAALAAPAIAADLPSWLREASAAPTPATRAPAVVLLDQAEVTLDQSGLVRWTERGAVRVLEGPGREWCRAVAGYEEKTGRVIDLRAWLIRPSGVVVEVGKKQIVDLARVDFELYSEGRMQVLSGADQAEPGAVFGWEATTENHQPYANFLWAFQNRVPVVRSSFAVHAPVGWNVRSWRMRDGAGAAPESARTSWEERDLAAIPEEPGAPPLESLSARVAVSCEPPAGSALSARAFSDWAAVARWLSNLTAASGEPSDEVRARARALVAQEHSQLDSIRAVAGFVQAIRYVSVSMGLASGSGFVPHPPGEVLAHSYGDCKDKANLMRAMLRGVGIPADLVALCATDPDYVREEWPSPAQFDHCIVAIPLEPGRGAALNAWEKSALGGLLFFDATDPHTRLGDLPLAEQGAGALVISPRSNGLVRLPALAPRAAAFERRVDLRLEADGSIAGTIQERATGQSAARERAARQQSREEYRAGTEHWLSRTVSNAALQSLQMSDDPRLDRCVTDLRFSAPQYAQSMNAKLMLFRPMVVGREPGLDVGRERLTPFVARRGTYLDSVTVALPEGFQVDEMPPPSKVESSFGAYAASCHVDGQRLRFVRSLTLEGGRIPVSQWERAKDFFAQIKTADEMPVVLVRK